MTEVAAVQPPSWSSSGRLAALGSMKMKDQSKRGAWWLDATGARYVEVQRTVAAEDGTFDLAVHPVGSEAYVWLTPAELVRHGFVQVGAK